MSTIPKPILNEVFADNGAHSHWEVIDANNGKILWSEQLATDGREQKPTLSDKIDSEDDDIYDRIIPPGIGKGDGVEQMFFNDGYYAGYKFGREELEKEFLKQKIGIEDFAKEQIQFKDDQITALQSSLKEKEKECEELKLAYEWAEKDKEEFRNILAENSNQIEELKAENERLKSQLAFQEEQLIKAKGNP